MSTAVYIRQLSGPFLTAGFQNKTCGKWLSKKNFPGEIVYIDNLDDVFKSNRMDGSSASIYNHQGLVIYSVAVLGDTLEEIIKIIKKLIDRGIKIYAITEPIDFQNFGNDPQQNMLLSACIGCALYQNEFWKNL